MLTKSIFALALMITAANASGIGEPEHRQWAICDNKDTAISIAEMAVGDNGAEAAYWSWENAKKYGLCREAYADMFPQEVIWRKKAVDKSVLRVVRIADESNVKFYWITFEPVTGEKPL